MEETGRKDNASHEHRSGRTTGEKPPTSQEIYNQQTKEAPDYENLQSSRKQIKSKGLCLPQSNRNNNNKKLYEQSNTQGMQYYMFNTRAKMIKIKGNYRNKHNDMSFRWCKEDDETQIHILNHCPEFKAITNNTKHKVYYQDHKESTQQAATTLHKVIEKIDKDDT